MVCQTRYTLNLAIAVLLFLVFTALCAQAQPYVQRFDGIPFSIGGTISPSPFNGGMNNARYQFADIDADGDKDLFTFDADTTLYFYRNTGTASNAVFRLETKKFQNLSFENWFYMCDIDNDNDLDLFTGGEFQTVKYYRNAGSPANPSFVLQIPELRTASDTVIYSESNCVPAFADMDNDGDLDFFTGQSLGTITYYENIGTPNSFSFRYVTDFWQNLIIISPAFDNRHGANSLEFVDINNDLDFDLFWGDLFSKGIYYIRNDGTPSQPNVVIADSVYPPGSPYISSGYNSTRFVDIDADGDRDLFVSVLYLSQNNSNFTFFRNTGTASNPVFQRITDNYLVNLDVGGSSNPAFTDIDNDGDKDLFMGNDYARLAFFRNTGTVNSPAYQLVSDSLPILSESFNYSPAFGDLDNDGDKDLILGSYIRDSLWFFRNTGTPGSFNFTLEARGNQIGLTGLGQSSTPALVDIDADNDLDLFAGGTNGRILFYENTGSVSSFSFVLRSNFYAGIDAGDESIPRFADIDRDGDKDLFIGKQDGKISFYRNTGNAQNPAFSLVTTEYAGISVHSGSCPEFFDFDNDSDLDIFAGNIKGGLFFFRNDELSSVGSGIIALPGTFSILQNFPNPFNPSTLVKLRFPSGVIAGITITDINGRIVEDLGRKYYGAGTFEYVWDGSDQPTGIYFFRVSAQGVSKAIRMLFVK